MTLLSSTPVLYESTLNSSMHTARLSTSVTRRYRSLMLVRQGGSSSTALCNTSPLLYGLPRKFVMLILPTTHFVVSCLTSHRGPVLQQQHLHPPSSRRPALQSLQSMYRKQLMSSSIAQIRVSRLSDPTAKGKTTSRHEQQASEALSTCQPL